MTNWTHDPFELKLKHAISEMNAACSEMESLPIIVITEDEGTKDIKYITPTGLDLGQVRHALGHLLEDIDVWLGIR